MGVDELRLDNLKPPQGSRKKRKRVGRGTSSGHGKTSGRGQKGQLSRSGGGKGPGFEGGQTPLQRRLPKLPGFKSRFKKEYEVINLSQLDKLNEGTVVDPGFLSDKGWLTRKLPVKVLGDGELTKALTVKAQAFSRSAQEKIEKAGGTSEVLP